MDTSGCLPLLLKTALEDYHKKDALEYVQEVFDFGTDVKFGRWKARREMLGTRLAARKFQRKLVFVTAHSEITRGDLFAGRCAQGRDVSMEVVKSGSTPVRCPVKSRRKQMKEESRGLDKRLVRPELVTAWIQRLRITSVDPLRRFWSRGVDGDRDGDGQEQE